MEQMPKKCQPGPEPIVACSDDIPKIIYKVNRHLGPENNQIQQFIFVGDYLSESPIKEILAKIETNDPLDEMESNMLKTTFGDQYSGILGMNNNYPKQYIPEYIERDDTIAKIKGKIQIHLAEGKYKNHITDHRTMPVSLQYLWTSTCHSNNKNKVQIRDESLGYYYYYNLTLDGVEKQLQQYQSLLEDLQALGEDEDLDDETLKELENINMGPDELQNEITKLRNYQNELKGSKKPRKVKKRLTEITPVEDYQRITLYDNNPFHALPNDVTVYTEVDKLFVNKDGTKSNVAILEDQNDKILQDYLLQEHRTINLINLVDFLKYLQEQDYVFTEDNGEAAINQAMGLDTTIILRFINGFLARYWTKVDYPIPDEIKKQAGAAIKTLTPVQFDLFKFINDSYVNTTNITLNNSLTTEAMKFQPLIKVIEEDRDKIAIINNETISHDIDFSICRVLEVVIHVNYEQQQTEFIDLLKILDLYPLSEQVPHVKFRGDTAEESFHKVYKKIAKTIPSDELTRWVSDKPQKTKSADDIESVKYVVFGKGLSYKVKLYEIPSDDPNKPPTPKYGTLILLKDGKIEIKCSWDENFNADLNDIKKALEIFKEVIQQINKLQYHLRGANRRLKIGIPDPNFIGNPYSNTQLTLINTSTLVDYGQDIDFSQLNQLAQCFHQAYASVIRTDITLAGNQITNIPTNILKLRYKRISFYDEMSEYAKLVYDLRQQVRKPSEDTIAQVLVEQFKKDKLTLQDAKEIARLNLSKKIKHPGIDVRLRPTKTTAGQQKENEYKIFILGAKSLLQLSQVHYFIKQLLYLFKNGDQLDFIKLDDLIETCEVDTDALRRANPELAIQAELDEAQERKEKAEEEEDADLWDIPEEEEDADLWDIPEEEEEEIEGAVEEEEEEEEAVPTPAPKKKRKSLQGRTSPISRLENADPELFPTGYAKYCQKSDFRQPMVISNDRFQVLKKSLNDELAQVQALPAGPVKQSKLKDVKRKLELIDNDHGLVLRDDYFYFCPLAFCYTCETILMPDEVEEHINQLGHEAIYEIPEEKRKAYKDGKHHQYVGFLDPGKHTKGLCMPCCFKLPKQKKRIFNQCLGQSQQIEEVKTEDTISPLYVFNQDKRFIAKDRYAFLPKDIDVLLNQGKPDINCETVNGYIRTGNKFNCYLRKGMPSHISEVKNTFLNAIADLLEGEPQTGEDFREYLISKVSKSMFNTLLNGNLAVIFQDQDGESDPYNNFMDYLAEDFVNEDFLWDLVTAPGIILPSGFNLIIFEVILNPNKSVRSIMLKCPIGFDLDVLFKEDRHSVLLYKYQDHYEPIYRVFDKQSSLLQEKFFPPDSKFIKDILELYEDCQPDDDLDLMRNLREFYQKYDIPDLAIEKPLSARQTYDILNEIIQEHDLDELQVIGQIVDTMNKVTHLVLINGMKIPVKPSVIIADDDIEVRDYYNTKELEELAQAVKQNRQPNLSMPKYEEVFPILYNLNDLSIQLGENKWLNLVPRMNILDDSGQLVVGLLLKNGLVIEVPPVPVDQLDQITVETPTGQVKASQIDSDILDYRQSFRDRSVKEKPRVDYALETDTQYRDDIRVAQITKTHFEEETYQRIRFELSRFLQEPGDDNQEYKQKIIDLVEDDEKTVKNKRKELYDLLLPLLRDVLTTSQPSNENYLVGYQKPNVRVACFEQDPDKCKNDPHCSSVPANENDGNVDNNEQPKVCKLFVPKKNLINESKTNIIYYTHLLSDELIRNPYKANEILEDQIDTYIRREIRRADQDEMIFMEKDPSQKKNRVKKLYQRGIDYIEQWSTHPEIHRAQDEIKRRELQPLSNYWLNLIGDKTGLRRIQSQNETNDYIYKMIVNALNQREIILDKEPVHTVRNLKDTVWNFVSDQLESEGANNGQIGRPGWKLFLHNLFDLLATESEIYRHDYVKDEFEREYKSQNHYLSSHELALISRIYSVKFIILRSRRYPREDPTSPMFICLRTTQTLGNWYIILELVGHEKYDIVIDTSISRVKHSPFPYRYIFQESPGEPDQKRQIPENLYDQWQKTCPDDNKKVIDPNNYTLILDPTPEPKNLQSLKTGSVYAVDPTTGKKMELHGKKPAMIRISPISSPEGSPKTSPRKKQQITIIQRKKPSDKPQQQQDQELQQKIKISVIRPKQKLTEAQQLEQKIKIKEISPIKPAKSTQIPGQQQQLPKPDEKKKKINLIKKK